MTGQIAGDWSKWHRVKGHLEGQRLAAVQASFETGLLLGWANKKEAFHPAIVHAMTVQRDDMDLVVARFPQISQMSPEQQVVFLVVRMTRILEQAENRWLA